MRKILRTIFIIAVVMTMSIIAVYGVEQEEITLMSDISNGKPVLTWEYEGEVEVLRAESSMAGFEVIGTSSEGTYTDYTALPGIEYIYNVRIFSDEGEISSNEVKILCRLANPEPVSSNDPDTGKPVLTWTHIDGADKYEIYRSDSENGVFTKMYTQTGNVYTNTKASAGDLYYYKVKAVFELNSDADSDFSAVVKRTCDLPRTAVRTSNVASSGKIRLIWDAVKGASEYKVYRGKTKSGTYYLMTTTNKTEYVNKSAVACQKYYYKVKALYAGNSEANSAYSAPVLRTCDLASPVIKMDSSAKAKPKLSWESIKNADSYVIYRSTSSNGTYQKIYTSKKTTFINTKTTPGKKYYYKVKALSNTSSEAASAFSTIKSRYVFDVNKKMVALTFDDGPGPYTKEIVNCLKKNNSYATFFVVGQRVNAYKSALKSAYDSGNEIGNHTYSHPMLTSVSTSGIKSQITRTDNAVKNVTGEIPKIMRPPGGDFNNRVKAAVGKPLIYWSIDTLDWKTRSKSATVNSVMNNVRDGSIVLMHDIHYPTKEAALELIPKLKKKGYQIVTLSDLAKYRGYNLKKGTVYFSFY